MKRYNRWSNLITSIIVDVFVALFLIFASLPCFKDYVRYWCTLHDCPSFEVYRTLFEHPFGCCVAASTCMIAFAVLSTASLVIDVLHAAGPFKECKAYRLLHICFSFTCFGLATASMVCLSAASVLPETFGRLPGYYCCLAFVCVLIVLEGVRFILGLIANHKAKYTSSGVSAPREVKYNSDYAVKKLKDLKELLNQGIISEEEYNEAKKKYVKDL